LLFILPPGGPVSPERLAAVAVPSLTFLFIRRLWPLVALFAFFLAGLAHIHGALQPVDDPHHIAPRFPDRTRS